MMGTGKKQVAEFLGEMELALDRLEQRLDVLENRHSLPEPSSDVREWIRDGYALVDWWVEYPSG